MILTLPTAPYTVIRVVMPDRDPRDKQVWIRGPRYWSPLGDHACWTQGEMQERITGFESLASPENVITFKQDNEHDADVRRKTAQAVLNRVRERPDLPLLTIEREFGVQS